MVVKTILPFVILMLSIFNFRLYASDMPEEAQETRVLLVCFADETTEEILKHYQEKRNIPDSHVLFIRGAVGRDAFWPSNYDNFIRPLKDKLDSLGPASIYYIVLINPPRLIRYQDEVVSTCTLTMCAYNLKDGFGFYNKNNPCYRPKGLFTHPLPAFSHDVYTRQGYFYIVSSLEGKRVMAQIDDAQIEPQEGVDIIDSRYGTYSDKPASYWDLDNYPYISGYGYQAMDLKHVAVAKWFEKTGKEDYLWHHQGHVYGAKGEPRIRAKSWVGWYDGRYYNKFDWQPKSYWSQVHSGKAAALSAWEAGCTFVCMPLFEPRTAGVPQPAEFSYYIQSGYTYGEAVMYSLPQLLWATHCIGDPLTRRGIQK
jgi:hypothetical protein